MTLHTEFAEGFLLAKVAGPSSYDGWMKRYKEICDTAAANGFHNVLIDVLALTGDLSHRERYKMGREAAAYVATNRMSLKIAVFGKEPLLTGFAVSVAQNRGLNTEAFYDRRRALAWLLDPGKSAGRPAAELEK